LNNRIEPTLESESEDLQTKYQDILDAKRNAKKNASPQPKMAKGRNNNLKPNNTFN
jgi:hypothetical protein